MKTLFNYFCFKLIVVTSLNGREFVIPIISEFLVAIKNVYNIYI